MPKVTTREGFIKAWFSYEPYVMLDGFKSEASRMVVEMDEWMKTQEEYDPDMMFEIYEESGYFELVKRAKKYRKRIYNRNAALKKLKIDIGVAETRYNLTHDAEYVKLIADLKEQESEFQDEQMKYVWRIAKIYGHLLTVGQVSFLSRSPELEEEIDEYNYEKDLS